MRFHTEGSAFSQKLLCCLNVSFLWLTEMVWEISTFMLHLKQALLLVCCASKFIRACCRVKKVIYWISGFLWWFFKDIAKLKWLNSSRLLWFTINIKCYFVCMELDHLMTLCGQIHLRTRDCHRSKHKATSAPFRPWLLKGCFPPWNAFNKSPHLTFCDLLQEEKAACGSDHFCW